MVDKGHHGISDISSHFKHNLSGKRTLCNPPGCPIWRHWCGGDPLIEVIAAGSPAHANVAAVSSAIAVEDCALELLPTLLDGSRRESANGEEKGIVLRL